ncbi:hypothetical protein Tco_0157549 [Tanacetum coccineum]
MVFGGNTRDLGSFREEMDKTTTKPSELVFELVVNESNVECQPKVWSDAPIIKEYESDSEDEYVSIPTKQQETPSFANQQVKTPRETVKNQFTHSQKPKVDKKELGYGFTVRACFVCRSLNHLIRDCDFHEKRMARKAELTNGWNRKSSQREIRQTWNNVQRVNKQNQFVPAAVLTRTGKIPVNTARASGTKNVSTARQSFNRQAVLTSTAMKVNTVKPIVNRVRPANVFHKTHSPSSRPFKKTTVLSTNFSKQKVYTAKVNAVSTVSGKRETTVKPSADYPHRALKNKGIVDSGCSRHMTGNKAYLAEFQDFNGGPVAFGGSKGYITGKGKIKTGKLDFEDVCFLKELQHFNLFSVSQMCDKKNKVLFTDSECLVLSPEFKLPDKNQVLLKIPRQNNMYSFNLENIVPSGVTLNSGSYTDRLLALRLQDEEREQFTVEERAKFLHDTIAAQRRFLAEQRAIAIRNKPPTRTQLRNQMMTYFKHVGNKKHSDLKNKTFEDIQALYEKVKMFDESFTVVGSTEDERRIKEMNEGVKDPDQKSLKKRVVEETPKKEDTAKKRPQSDVDSDDEHRKCLKIVTFKGTMDSEIMERKSVIARLNKVSSPDGDYLVIYRANGNFRAFNYLLEIMMESSQEENDQSDFWDDQQDWEIVTWILYKACGKLKEKETPTSTIFGDDETIAKVLLNMSQAKAVSREKEKGVEFKDIEETDRPRPTSTRSLLTLKPLPKIDPKDKGKKKIEEEDESESESDGIPEAEKKFKQLASDEEMARKIQEEWEGEEERNRLAEEKATNEALIRNYDDIKARIEADRLLAEKLQEEEREQFTIEERAKFLHDTIAAQRKFLAQQRSEAIRNRPPTKNQLRNQMMTYLKHVGNFKHSDLKTKKFEEIQALYEKIKRSDEDFISIGSAEDERLIKKMNEKGIDSSKNEMVKEEDKEEEGTKKRKGGHIKMIARKKARKQSDVDSEDEHKKCLKIVTFESILDSEIMEKKSVIARLNKVSSPDGYYLVIYRANGNFRAFNYLMEGDLNIMMESSTEWNEQSDFWSGQQDWKIVTWRLYESCGVCILEFEDGIVIHMLVERRYPLSKDLLQRMLDLGLEVERESYVALDLIRGVAIVENRKKQGSKEVGELISCGLLLKAVEVKQEKMKQLDIRVVVGFRRKGLWAFYPMFFEIVPPVLHFGVPTIRRRESAALVTNQFWNSTCRVGGIPGKSLGKTSGKSLTIGTSSSCFSFDLSLYFLRVKLPQWKSSSYAQNPVTSSNITILSAGQQLLHGPGILDQDYKSNLVQPQQQSQNHIDLRASAAAQIELSASSPPQTRVGGWYRCGSMLSNGAPWM